MTRTAPPHRTPPHRTPPRTPPHLPAVVLRPLRAANPFESTVERLAAAIRLGVYDSGEQLPPERELAVQLGVSRINLREAIAALREAKLVETRRGRGGGTVVTYEGHIADGPTDPDRLLERGPQLRDALDFRSVVEPGAAYLAANRDLSADERRWLTDSERAVRQGYQSSPAAHRVADSRLHLGIAALSGSPMLIDAVTRVRAALDEMLACIPVLPRNIEHSHTQHAAIVTAILTGDAETARDVMHEHCQATSALVRGLLG